VNHIHERRDTPPIIIEKAAASENRKMNLQPIARLSFAKQHMRRRTTEAR
jgi:hypothetical protein